MKSNLLIKKNFMLKSYRSEYSLSLETPDMALPVLIDSLLKELLPAEAFESKELTDLKGHGLQSLTSDNSTEASSPADDQLLYVGGRIVSEELDTEEQEFSAKVTTNFKAFAGKRSIQHSSKVSYRGALPSYVLLREIGRAVPVEILDFRLGMEFFKSSFAWASLGSAPAVYETLMLRCTPMEIELKLLAEQLETPDTLPFSKEERLSKLDAVFLRVLNVSILKDYQKKMSEG